MKKIKYLLLIYSIILLSLDALGQVCQIGTTTYDTLDEALEVVKSGETIRLLTGITHNDVVFLDSKNVTFELSSGTYLTIDASAKWGYPALATAGNLTFTGTGNVTVKGDDVGIHLTGIGMQTLTFNNEGTVTIQTTGTGEGTAGIVSDNAATAITGRATLRIEASGANGDGIFMSNRFANLNITGTGSSGLDFRAHGAGTGHGLRLIANGNTTVNINFMRRDILSGFYGGEYGNGLFYDGFEGRHTINNNGAGRLEIVGGSVSGNGIYTTTNLILINNSDEFSVRGNGTGCGIKLEQFHREIHANRISVSGGSAIPTVPGQSAGLWLMGDTRIYILGSDFSPQGATGIYVDEDWVTLTISTNAQVIGNNFFAPTSTIPNGNGIYAVGELRLEQGSQVSDTRVVIRAKGGTGGEGIFIGDGKYFSIGEGRDLTLSGKLTVETIGGANAKGIALSGEGKVNFTDSDQKLTVSNNSGSEESVPCHKLSELSDLSKLFWTTKGDGAISPDDDVMDDDVVFIIQASEGTAKTATIFLSEGKKSWIGIDEKWNEDYNWEDGEIPANAECVVIPKVGAGRTYPVLDKDGQIVTVAEIHFAPGAMLGNQHKLKGKAFVQYDLNKHSRWNMLSIPLGQAYPGDFTFGGYPLTWVRTFEMRETTTAEGSITKGTWVTARGSATPFTHGDGFVLWLDEDKTKVMGLSQLDGIHKIPFFHHYEENSPDFELYKKVHHNHDYKKETGESGKLGESTFYNYDVTNNNERIDESYAVLRKDSAYLLAGETVLKELNFGANNQAGTNIFALVGNPYMAVLDYKKLYADNSNAIKDSYHIWTGLGYTTFTPEGPTGVEGETEPKEQLIAPLQSFIVEGNGSESSLQFNVSMTTVDESVVLRSSASNINKLDIVAGNPVAKVRTFIAKREGGQDSFGERDSRKIINKISDVPEVYTLKPLNGRSIATGANIIDTDDILIPIGLATSYAGNITLLFRGMDTYDANVNLIDVETRQTFNLTGLTSYDYLFNYIPKKVNGETAVCEDRFFIRISKTVTDIPKTLVAEKVHVFESNGLIQVIGSASNQVKDVTVYDLQGALIYKATAINTVSHTINHNLLSGMYIVKAVSAMNIDNVKVVIK